MKSYQWKAALCALVAASGFAVFVAIMLSVLGCTPAPSPGPMPPDASDGGPVLDAAPAPALTPCEAACHRLAELGCGEGGNPRCASVCRLTEAQLSHSFDPGCIVAAPSQSAVRLCGHGLYCGLDPDPAVASSASPQTNARHR